MKGIIIQKGRYGATQSYADMLGAAMHLPVVLSDKVFQDQLVEYDYLLLGSSVYMGKLEILRWIRENLGILMNKKLFFFIVCGSSPHEKEKMEKIIRDNIPAEIRSRAEIFFMRGRLKRAGLSTRDRILLRIGAWLTRDPQQRRNMLTDYDEVSPDKLLPLQNAVQAYQTSSRPQYRPAHSLL